MFEEKILKEFSRELMENLKKMDMIFKEQLFKKFWKKPKKNFWKFKKNQQESTQKCHTKVADKFLRKSLKNFLMKYLEYIRNP